METFTVFHVHPFGPLEEDEVIQRGLVERCQPHDYVRRMVARCDGEVRPVEVRSAADRDEQIVHTSEVGHLLKGNLQDYFTPALNRISLG
jgi:hypothetical protein